MTVTPEEIRSVLLFVFTRLTTGVETVHTAELHNDPRVVFTPCSTATINKREEDSTAVMPLMVCVACTSVNFVVEVGGGLGDFVVVKVGFAVGFPAAIDGAAVFPAISCGKRREENEGIEMVKEDEEE